MVETPWGESTRLRERMLGGGRRRDVDAVAANQRERLFAATVACSWERGFAATTVAEIVACSGVSRRDFYRHFPDKAACATAAIEATVAEAMALGEASYDGHGAALRSLLDFAAAQPAAMRLGLLEAGSIGARAELAVERSQLGAAELYRRALEERNGVSMPPAIAAAVIGGLRRVICRRLEDRREAELAALAGPLWSWAFSYEPPPRRLPRPRPAPGQAASYRPGEPTERVLAATLELVAERGYGALTVGEIVARAGVSLSTLYASFGGKEEALLAALSAARLRLGAVALPPFHRASGWPQAVRQGTAATLAFLAAEPDLARVLVAGSDGAGERARAERDRILADCEALLLRGDHPPGGEHAVAAEASVGAVLELLGAEMRRAGPERLQEIAPLACYLALVPFLGAEEACEVARERG